MEQRIGAYAVITDDRGRILLSHWVRDRAAAWTLPGGGLEDREDPETCVKREVREETGYRIGAIERVGIDTQVIPSARRLDGAGYGDLRLVRHVYRAMIVGGSMADERGGSTDKARWFSLDSLPTRRTKLVEIGLRLSRNPRFGVAGDWPSVAR